MRALERTADFHHANGVGQTPLQRHRVGGRDLLLKLELANPSGSFKDRGAHAIITNAKLRGLTSGVCASTGNHAGAIKLAAEALTLDVSYFVPESAPETKKAKIQKGGAEVIIGGHDFQASLELAQAFAAANNRGMLHPYDSPDTVIGQATMGFELFKDAWDEPGLILVPFGGGGLSAGLLLAAVAFRSRAKIVLVVSDRARAAKVSWETRRRTLVKTSHSLADGVNVAQPGRFPWEVLRLFKDRIAGVIEVSDEEVANAMTYLKQDAGVPAEGAGAVATAGALSGKVDHLPGSDRGVVCVVSGGNIGEREHAAACAGATEPGLARL